MAYNYFEIKVDGIADFIDVSVFWMIMSGSPGGSPGGCICFQSSSTLFTVFTFSLLPSYSVQCARRIGE